MTLPPLKFVHVLYRTRRFEEMLAWYKTVFRAKIQYQNPALAFLTYDQERHRFAFANMDLIDPGGGRPGDRGPSVSTMWPTPVPLSEISSRDTPT
jgi:hypothetical protein